MARATATPFTSSDLRALLDSMPGSAFVVGPDRRIVAENTEFRERFTRGRTASGRTCFETSHGLDRPCERTGMACPVTRCMESGAPQRVLHLRCAGRDEAPQDVLAYPIPRGAGDDFWVLGVIRPSAARLDEDARPRIARPFVEPGTIRAVRAVAASDAPVLLLGEGGTGRRTVARTVHGWSPRGDRPFVPLDCATVCAHLAGESNRDGIFGDDPLAVSWAIALAEAVRGGTLYLEGLDRVGSGCQAMLLRLIDGWAEFGDPRPPAASPRFRLVTAAATDLGTRVRRGLFRSDLYFRISGFPVRLKPLRQRREELPAIVEAALARLHPGNPRRVTRDVIGILQGHDYPGNLDELLGILESAARRSEGAVLQPEHLPDTVVARAGRQAAVGRRRPVVRSSGRLARESAGRSGAHPRRP